MKHLEFNKKGIKHSPIKYWKTDIVTEVAIYKGQRGENPEINFLVKYKEENKRLRAPSHTHWITDMLVKAESNRDLLLSYIEDMIKFYDNTEPFKSIEEITNYQLTQVDRMKSKHQLLEGHGYYSIGTLTAFIELFSKCEKQAAGAFMFRELLSLIKQYCEGTKDFYQIVGLSRRV
jgi:hypothetical protein